MALGDRAHLERGTRGGSATFANAAGKATSAAATLSVHKAPAVTKQPLDKTVLEGQSAVFEATASGFPTPAVQWEVSSDGGTSWSPIAGATSSQLTIASATDSESGNQFRAAFTNVGGEARSNATTLTVHSPPAVTGQPSSQTVEENESTTFEATASGFPTPTVQWEISTNSGSTWRAIAEARQAS